jgi:hypothetical protein
MKIEINPECVKLRNEIIKMPNYTGKIDPRTLSLRQLTQLKRMLIIEQMEIDARHCFVSLKESIEEQVISALHLTDLGYEGI